MERGFVVVESGETSVMGTSEPLLASDEGHVAGIEEPIEKQVDESLPPGEIAVEEGKGSSSRRAGGLPPIIAVGRLCSKLLPTRRPSNLDELQRFQNYLFFLTLDQSTTARLVCSWFNFVFFTTIVPVLSWVYVSCDDCDYEHSHPFQRLVDFSESCLAAVAFVCLTKIIRKYGLRKVLLLDKLGREAMSIRQGYEKELQNSFKLLVYILIPSMIVELVHKIWWFLFASVEIPFLEKDPVLNIVLFTMTMLAWLYKSTVFLFVCVLFRLMCSLQLLRLQGYITLLEETSDVSIILKEHMRIRDQLLVISHRYRVFLLLSMFTITFSQLTSLFVVTESHNNINFFRAGDLVVCSIVQLSGFAVCLHGAAKITHRAQRIMSIVSQWHAVATCSPATVSHLDGRHSTAQRLGPAHPLLYNSSYGDLENSIKVAEREAHPIPHDIEAFQQRQALMKYLRFSRGGVSIYGFNLDRIFLSSMFDLHFSVTVAFC